MASNRAAARGGTMTGHAEKSREYEGFEQGPIRPPSEAESLLIRVTRNCPWNKCTFCPVYKTARFSIRPVEHVKRDIDAVHAHVTRLTAMAEQTGGVTREDLRGLYEEGPSSDRQALAAAIDWVFVGKMRSVFLQDANSLVVKPAALVEILTHLRERFPAIERITSYARSQTVARISDDDLRAIGEAGLNRIHIGMESGSDEVLKRVRKGVTKAEHVEAGQKVKRVGIELSEYVMPGLGGRALSRVHALESADALNRIDADFIRLRTLAIPGSVPLFEEYDRGEFDKCTDLEVAEETLAFIEALDGVTSAVRSDHILNLFGDLEGVLPGDKDRMIGLLRRFIEMTPERRMLYQVGRRCGIFERMDDLGDAARAGEADRVCRQFGITPANVDAVTDQLMRRFI